MSGSAAPANTSSRTARRVTAASGPPASPAQGRRHPLASSIASRQSGEGADRLRVAGRSSGGPSHRMAGARDHWRWCREVVRVRDVRAGVRLRGEREPPMRVGCRQGARRARPGTRRAALQRGRSGDRDRHRVPAQSRSGGGRLSGRLGQHAPERVVVQAWLPVRVRGRRAPEPRGPGRAGPRSDPRLERAIDWLLGKQDARGRWKNEYAYNGKTWVGIERQGQPSKWVTLRACRFLRAALASSARDDTAMRSAPHA